MFAISAARAKEIDFRHGGLDPRGASEFGLCQVGLGALPPDAVPRL